MDLVGEIRKIDTTQGIHLVLKIENDLADIAEDLEELFNQKANIRITKAYSKRSTTANGYAWLLIDKISQKIGATSIEVYKKAVMEDGVSELICMKTEAVDTFVKEWSNKGIGWFATTEDSKLAGCTNVRVFYGSSCYDTKQMSKLIKNIVNDAKDLGIEIPNDEFLRGLFS